ncbi:MAG: hypothetical protein ACM3ZF_11350 [Mycobacterium leprae]
MDEVTVERALRHVGQLQHFSEAQIREIALIVIAVIRAEDPARQRRDADARADRDRLERLGRD